MINQAYRFPDLTVPDEEIDLLELTSSESSIEGELRGDYWRGEDLFDIGWVFNVIIGGVDDSPLADDV